MGNAAPNSLPPAEVVTPAERPDALAARLRKAREQLDEIFDRIEDEMVEEWAEIEVFVAEGIVHVRRVMVLVVGATLVLLGALLVITPFPGSPLVLGGLSLLAAEFAWARLWRIRLERAAAEALEELRERLDFDDDDGASEGGDVA